MFTNDWKRETTLAPTTVARPIAASSSALSIHQRYGFFASITCSGVAD